MQRRDPDLTDIIEYLEAETLPSNSNAARRILLLSEVFYIGEDGLLYHLNKIRRQASRTPHSQLVIPTELRFEVLTNAHDCVTVAHLGTHKTYQKIRERCYWRNMFKDCEHWCKTCVDCSMRKTP